MVMPWTLVKLKEDKKSMKHAILHIYMLFEQCCYKNFFFYDR